MLRYERPGPARANTEAIPHLTTTHLRACHRTTFLLLQELRDGVLEEVTLISVQLIEDLLVTLLICAELAIQFLRRDNKRREQ